MPATRNAPAIVLLIGLRGSGKTSVGRALANALGRPFIDLDDETPALMGFANVRAAWAARGESAFRAAEREALALVLTRTGAVIALGGGTPEAPGAEALINETRRGGRAVVVYLRADANTLRERLRAADNANRPSLTGKGALDEISDVLARRDARYTALADAVIETAPAHSVEYVADDVARTIDNLTPRGGSGPT